jgi:hypothetical protein
MKTFVSLVVVCAAGTLAAEPAGAERPERERESFTVSDVIDCSAFGQGWAFFDEFVDEFDVRRQYVYDWNGDLVRIMEHWEQMSTDVNSVTGLTIHEDNHFLVDVDLVDMTVTLSGAINNAQRRGVGSVIQTAGHKVFELDLSQDPPLGSLLFNGGPFGGSDEDFCRAIA